MIHRKIKAPKRHDGEISFRREKPIGLLKSEEHMESISIIAGSWIFVVVQVLQQFEYLLKRSTDRHVSFLNVC